MGLTAETVVVTVTDPSIERVAISEVSSDAAKSGEKVADISWGETAFPSGPEILMLWVKVNSYDERVPAQKVLNRLPNVLENRFRELDVAHQLDKERCDLLTEETQQGQNRDSKRKKTNAMLLHAFIMFRSMSMLKSLHSKKHVSTRKLKRSRRSWKALQHVREVLEELIAEVGKRGTEEADKDPVIAELQQAVELRAEIVKRMRESKSPSVGDSRRREPACGTQGRAG